MNKRYFKISKFLVKENKIYFEIESPKEIKKFLNGNFAFVEYDESVEEVEKSILIIPAISFLVPISWAFGLDIFVENIDQTYLQTLEDIKNVFQKWYPQFSFSAKIIPNNVTINAFNGEKIGLLFSGGVDSLTSFVRHKEKNPDLFTIYGADIPLGKENLWKRVKNNLSYFASENKTKIHFVKSNIPSLCNETLLAKQFRLVGWWGPVAHALILLGLIAPITQKRRIGTVLIAATHTKEFTSPWGSDPRIDNKISWADVKVLHDGYELSRFEKIRYLKQYPIFLNFLRVCFSSYKNYNCGKCEKCANTLLSLILNDIDPNTCNFKINKSVFKYIKNCLEKRKFVLNESEKFLWKNIQKNIPKKMNNKLYSGAENFFEWLKHFDFDKYEANKWQSLIFGIFYYFNEYGVLRTFKDFVARKIKKIL